MQTLRNFPGRNITRYHNDMSMMEKETDTKKNNKPCPGCGGSGQTSYFYGESRFMLTHEDCPDCCGTGVLLEDKEAKPKEEDE